MQNEKICMASAWLTRKFVAIRRIPIVLLEPQAAHWLENCVRTFRTHSQGGSLRFAECAVARSDLSRVPPRPLVIPDVMTLETLAGCSGVDAAPADGSSGLYGRPGAALSRRSARSLANVKNPAAPAVKREAEQ